MDDNSAAPSPDERLAGVQERITIERELVGETLEALAYKTDVKARGSEALADGLETAKVVASQAAEQATVHAIDLAGRATEFAAAGLDAAQHTTNEALETAFESASNVDPRFLRRVAIAALAGILVYVGVTYGRRRKGDSPDEASLGTSG